MNTRNTTRPNAGIEEPYSHSGEQASYADLHPWLCHPYRTWPAAEKLSLLTCGAVGAVCDRPVFIDFWMNGRS